MVRTKSPTRVARTGICSSRMQYARVSLGEDDAQAPQQQKSAVSAVARVVDEYFESPILARIGPTVYAARVGPRVDEYDSRSGRETYIVADVAENDAGCKMSTVMFLPWHTLSFVRGDNPKLRQMLDAEKIMLPQHMYTPDKARSDMPLTFYTRNAGISYYTIGDDPAHVVAVMDAARSDGSQTGPQSVVDAVLLWRTKLLEHEVSADDK